MTSTSPAAQPDNTRKSRLKPAEILGLSAGIALFVGLTVLLTTHKPLFSLIGFGITFVLCLIMVSLIMLSIKPGAFDPTDAHAAPSPRPGETPPAP